MTDNRPAAMSAAALAWVTTPSCTPIAVAATMNGRDVAWSTPAMRALGLPMSRA